MHYLLFYEKVSDYAERNRLSKRPTATTVSLPWRERAGLGGPLEDPIDGSNVLLFRAESPAVAESFAARDPYVTGGVVSRWQVRPWRTVVGGEAAFPLPQ